jgi:hypothetical protein
MELNSGSKGGMAEVMGAAANRVGVPACVVAMPLK